MTGWFRRASGACSTMSAARAVLCLLVVGACTGKRVPPPPKPPTVVAAKPLRMRVIDWDDYVGQFVAVDSVDVRPKVSGYLIGVGFRDGDYVPKGKVLFVIDPRPYKAALDMANRSPSRDDRWLFFKAVTI
jgi:multidrug efflux pump subunit AcrA (membrane-fusion protein)